MKEVSCPNSTKVFTSERPVAAEDKSATKQKMTQPGCTKMAISQLLLRVAGSNLVGRTSKWYFIIKFSLLLSIVRCWREIRPDVGKKLKMSLLQIFFEITTQRNGFGPRGDNSHRLAYGMFHLSEGTFWLKNKFLGLFYSL